MRLIPLLSALTVASAVPLSAAAQDEAAARKAITAAYAVSDAAFAKGDLDGYFAHFAADGRMTQKDQTLTLTQARAVFANVLKQWQGRKQSITVEGVTLSGPDAAVVTNTQAIEGTFSGRRVRLSAKNRDAWARRDGRWRLTVSETLSQETTSTPDVPALTPEAERTVVGEIKAKATPLKSVEAGSGFEDLEPFGKAVGDARVVALGEASHGTREFFQMKHRLLEYLVEKKGFTVFAIEANFPESLAVDRYVTTGEGDPKKALAGMYFWTWNTEEVLTLIEWMRAYNKAPGDHPTLHFSSFDMQTPDVALDLARDFLRQKATPKAAAEAEKRFAPLVKLLSARRQAQTSREAKAPEPAEFADAAKQADAAVAVFDRERDALVKASSKEAFNTARQAAVVATQAARLSAAGRTGYGYRDQCMAANVRWLAETAYPGQKVVLWAHNGHVSTSGYGGGVVSMGEHLRKSLGNAMYVLGFAFDRGEIRAVPMAGGKMAGRVQPLSVPPAKPGTGDALLNAVGEPQFFLDMRGVPAETALGKWLRQPAVFRMPGAVWVTDNADAMSSPEKLADTFDGLIFIAESHASRPVGGEPAKPEGK